MLHQGFNVTKTNPNLEISFDLPEHTTVYANIWAVMHDPEHWNNPQDFNPGNCGVGQVVVKAKPLEGHG